MAEAVVSHLVINEIFFSIQGESNKAGLPTVFVRLTGCPLRCSYCDTAYAFHEGSRMSLEQIIGEVKRYETRHVTVTGGEPLAQKNCLALLRQLCDSDYQVSLETSGAIDISTVDKRVVRVMDIKTPGSGECDRNLLANLQLLTERDQIKFVIADEPDYEWSRDLIDLHGLSGRCEILFSPVHERLNATDLANWILRDRLAVRLQVQLHKYLWDAERGV